MVIALAYRILSTAGPHCRFHGAEGYAKTGEKEVGHACLGPPWATRGPVGTPARCPQIIQSGPPLPRYVFSAAVGLVLLLTVLFAVPVSAAPYWSEGWEYGAGHEVGTGGDGWTYPALYVPTYTTTAYAHSGNCSVEVHYLTEVSHAFSPALDSGRWLLSAWVYAPGPQDEVPDAANPFLAWDADQVSFDTWSGTVSMSGGSGSASLVFDAWAELRVDLDLDANHVTVTYNGTQLLDGAYTDAGEPQLSRLELVGLAGNSGLMYFDDLSLTPVLETETPLALKQGALEQLKSVLAGLSNRTQRSLVNKAISSLKCSLAPWYWLDDSHLREWSGSMVFHWERTAVSYLQSAVRWGVDPDLVEEPVIAALLSADRGLASTAITDAKDAGGRQRLISLAEWYLAKGEGYAAQHKPVLAIDVYRWAWWYAVSAY